MQKSCALHPNLLYSLPDAFTFEIIPGINYKVLYIAMC